MDSISALPFSIDLELKGLYFWLFELTWYLLLLAYFQNVLHSHGFYSHDRGVKWRRHSNQGHARRTLEQRAYDHQSS
jgi:hypothetical protein